MKRSQSGFTLIELVVVIVLLGILGVTALGRFQDLSGDAQAAANQGVAAEISAASAINFAAEQVNPGSGTAITGTAGNDDCSDGTLDNFFQSGAFPAADYDATAVGTPNCTAAGVTYQCRITAQGVTAAATDPAATIICTGG